MISRANLQPSPPSGAGEAGCSSSPTHRSRWGCSSHWCCRSHSWLCKCRFPRPRSPPPWFSAPAEGFGTSSSRCGSCARPSSTWWEAEGRPPLGTGAWWSSLASRTGGGSLYRQSLGGLRKKREEESLVFLLMIWHWFKEQSSVKPLHIGCCTEIQG